MKLGYSLSRLDQFSSSVVTLADVCNDRAEPGLDTTVSRPQGKGVKRVRQQKLSGHSASHPAGRPFGGLTPKENVPSPAGTEPSHGCGNPSSPHSFLPRTLLETC